MSSFNFRSIDGGVCAPQGFLASGVNVGVKPGATKKDCALIVSERAASIAGTFTTNIMRAPSVDWTEGVCIRGQARAVFINSGNANSCTGSQGALDAQTSAETVAGAIDASVTEIAILSTGVIGVPLPMDRITRGIQETAKALSVAGSEDAAVAIMTTDTTPKSIGCEVDIDGATVRLGGIAKGAGMILPNMATMLAAITTDAAIAPETLKPMLKRCVDRSFNCIGVDNDNSTNDSVLCLANGLSGIAPIAADTPAYTAFESALEHFCIQLAQALVRDGEGATKFVEIQVSGAEDYAGAHKIAKSIGASQLCKTAFFGQDPNWGRIACAAGYAGVRFDPRKLSIALENLVVVDSGIPTEYAEADAAAIMARHDIVVRVTVGDGPGHAVFWTSDLSHDYVTINADYRT